MRVRPGVYLDFKDVLIVPQRSSLDSRINVDIERTYNFLHSKRSWTGFGIIAANMDTTGSFKMARSLAEQKCLTALHKHYSIEDLTNFFVENQDLWNNTFYTIGISTSDIVKLEKVKHEINKKVGNKGFPVMLCLDAANGYTSNFVGHLKEMRKLFPETTIMAGNVCTGNMTEELILSGADILKCGIGGGSCCLTRVKTGVGMPQLSAIDICSYQAHGLKAHICGDGGITCPGDVSKNFAAGGDFCMIGGLFAGTDECDGEWVEKNEQKFLKFHGMSSKEAQEKWSGGLSSYRSSEGKEVLVPYKGPVKDVIQDIAGGVRSACTYVGASCIKDLPKCSEFVHTTVQENKYFGD